MFHKKKVETLFNFSNADEPVPCDAASPTPERDCSPSQTTYDGIQYKNDV